MGQMSNWNKFVQETLKQKDRFDKDKSNLPANFLDTKKAEKRGALFERNDNK